MKKNFIKSAKDVINLEIKGLVRLKKSKLALKDALARAKAVLTKQ